MYDLQIYDVRFICPFIAFIHLLPFDDIFHPYYTSQFGLA